jgi:hypothetical protein
MLEDGRIVRKHADQLRHHCASEVEDTQNRGNQGIGSGLEPPEQQSEGSRVQPEHDPGSPDPDSEADPSPTTSTTLTTQNTIPAQTETLTQPENSDSIGEYSSATVQPGNIGSTQLRRSSRTRQTT